MPNAEPFRVETLGTCQVDAPTHPGDGHRAGGYFVSDEQRILLDDDTTRLPSDAGGGDVPTLELAGPRRKIFFDPSETCIGIVTCGGLCPGLNDVIRGLVMVAHYRYGVERIYGFRYGYRGFAPDAPVMGLTPHVVSSIHERGGTLLGSSRGPQDPSQIVDRLVELEVNILFTIGGDGTLRGALAIVEEILRRRLKIAVVGVPKTIDNDIAYIDRSFGFETAYSTAMHVVQAAHTEARGAPNGVGLVKLMGRHSGFIACHATLAYSEVNFVLIPEVPFQLEGEAGLLAALQSRLEQRGHAVVVVAEGAGQELLENEGQQRDASGNIRLKDIGVFLVDRVKAHFDRIGQPVSLKYIDPSYVIRSVPATPADSVYCLRLAQHAVHAAMAGKTEMVVGSWHGRLVHVPMQEAISRRKQVDPHGDLWLSVLEATGQPCLAPN